MASRASCSLKIDTCLVCVDLLSHVMDLIISLNLKCRKAHTWIRKQVHCDEKMLWKMSKIPSKRRTDCKTNLFQEKKKKEDKTKQLGYFSLFTIYMSGMSVFVFFNRSFIQPDHYWRKGSLGISWHSKVGQEDTNEIQGWGRKGPKGKSSRRRDHSATGGMPLRPKPLSTLWRKWSRRKSGLM